ncbi:MAG: transcriptional regulator, MarR family [Pseudonocardia sp.]|jgi:DNA-binding MarR family transcriptional regulator|nr:transcriptional regulator, MarR family [Pseudonocardia sp.]
MARSYDDSVPDRHSLAEIEQAMFAHVGDLSVNLPAANAVSTLYRAANAVRSHLTNTVLRGYGLTWTGFVVLWVVWIWDGLETRHAAESAGISKATLTGVVKTLEGQGWITRETSDVDRRLVNLTLTASGAAMMQELYPAFNAAEADVVSCLSTRALTDLTRSLRLMVASLEGTSLERTDSRRHIEPARGA